MKNRQINITLFIIFLAIIVSLPIICVDRYQSRPDSPWQLLPFNVDSLSSFYKEYYRVIDDTALTFYLEDTTKTTVVILVDGWGVPYKEKQLVQDFSFFGDASPTFVVHKRSFNVTQTAESSEFSWEQTDGLFLFNGDSLECDKKWNYLSPIFLERTCCENCTDLSIAQKIDSLLSDKQWEKIAWTTHQTQKGNRDLLQQLLQDLSRISQKHPDVQFVIQGTHRPILGEPEIRRQYLAPWVPGVYLNATIKD